MDHHITAQALAALAFFACSTAASAGADNDMQEVAALDTAYQAAVERNDADAMAAILHEDMILVVGLGTVHTRDDLLKEARSGTTQFEHQVEDEGTQTVRLFGNDTAVVTARLWLKGKSGGKDFDRRLWFSDTYVRTTKGWRYAFGQASLALPAP